MNHPLSGHSSPSPAAGVWDSGLRRRRRATSERDGELGCCGDLSHRVPLSATPALHTNHRPLQPAPPVGHSSPGMERRWKNLRKGQTRGHSTYNVRDLDLTRPAAAKNPSRSQFKTTTVEVLRKTDLKALDSSPTFLQKLELSSREAR